MNYPKTKVYFDGWHYIGIPHEKQPWKKRKNKIKEKIIHEEKVKDIYKESNLLNSLKRDLQKTNTSISNLLSAIEKGIIYNHYKTTT